MQENTNKSIAVNSLILYIRLAIISISGLLYTRFSLQALGISDYGLYSVIACIITFISIINTIMVTTSNRFIAIAIGKNDQEEVCRQFSVNLVIHVLIALFTIVVALPLGHWYIVHHVAYDGDMHTVHTIFNVSIIAAAMSFIGVPYNGLLIARERFLVFCSTDVAMSLFKLFFTYLLIDHFEHKLLIYTFIMAFMTAFPTLVFYAYCRRNFADIVRFVFVKDLRKYRDVINFSIYIGIGAIATIGQAQGGALIINMFFGTMINAGLAVANSVGAILQTFANNAQKSISPQIVKNYAVGNIYRCISLVCLASKATYLSMLFVAIPFILIPEPIFGLWLKEVPPYTITFTHLLIADILIFSINAGVNDFVFATGKIKLYQIVTNALRACAIIIGYIALRHRMPPECLFYVYIAFSFLIFLVRPFIIVRITKFDVWALVRGSYVPVLLITLLFVPALCLKQLMGPMLSIVVAYTYFVILLYVIGLRKNERNYVNSLIRNKLFRKE